MTHAATCRPYRAGADLGSRVLAVMAEYGDPIPVRVLLDLLPRRFGVPVDGVACAGAVDALVAEGRVSRCAGDGDIVMLVRPGMTAALSRDPGSEASYMPALQRWLTGPFRTVVGGEGSLAYVVADTSRRGPRTGIWRRPDFVVANVTALPVLGVQVDVHSVELKTEDGCSVQSVYEAAAQTRETHYGHLVWVLPPGSPRERDLPSIADRCLEEGVGLVRMCTGRHAATDVVARPRRRPTEPAVVDAFLRERLPAGDVSRIAAAGRGA